MNHSDQTIAVASLADFLKGSEADRAQFIQTVGSSLQDIGFFALKDHGVDPDLIAKAYQLITEFFQSSETLKKSYEKPEIFRQRGFTSFGQEHAKDSEAPDLKEFWHVGREDYDEAENFEKRYHENIWPAELPEFKSVFLELYRQLDQCTQSLLRAVAIYLDLPEDCFANMAINSDTIFRLIHYPPIPEGSHPASIRAAAHEDINLITLLVESTEDGLELLEKDGTWRPIRALKGQIVVDAGDMLQNITNGLIKSTTHRVVNPTNDRSRRFSMPFFVHARYHCDLTPLPECVEKTGGEPLYPSLTAGEYLHQRLREIGLMDEAS